MKFILLCPRPVLFTQHWENTSTRRRRKDAYLAAVQQIYGYDASGDIYRIDSSGDGTAAAQVEHLRGLGAEGLAGDALDLGVEVVDFLVPHLDDAVKLVELELKPGLLAAVLLDADGGVDAGSRENGKRQNT